MQVKILFDKETLSPDFVGGWGVSYLIDGRVLFDTGEKADFLFANAAKMGVALSGIEQVVISHSHWDHRGGLWDLLEQNTKLELFVCPDFYRDFQQQLSGRKVVVVDQPQALNPEGSIYTTGCFLTQYKGNALQEQALILKTEKGISLICGCSHPGVLELVHRAQEVFSGEPLRAIIGGLHFMEQDSRTIRYLAQQLQERGLRFLGPAHCSGYEATVILQEYFPGRILEVKVGSSIEL